MGRCEECGQDELEVLQCFKDILLADYEKLKSVGMLRAIALLDAYMEKFK